MLFKTGALKEEFLWRQLNENIGKKQSTLHNKRKIDLFAGFKQLNNILNLGQTEK